MGNDIKERQIAMKTLPILAFEQRFLFPSSITLVLKEKVFSLSGDDLKITDINRNPYFKFKGKAFNVSKKKCYMLCMIGLYFLWNMNCFH